MTLLATIVVLGVLIFVHELGHFMAAKSVGIDVQRFSIGLPPTMVGFRRGETEYVIGWLPFGGYVKMGGMDDEVMERIEGGAGDGAAEGAKEGAEEGAGEGVVTQPREPKPGDFDGKPIWARTLVISAGVIMNMLFAYVVYTGVNAAWGRPELAENRVAQVLPELLPPGAEALAQLTSGTRLISVGDRQVSHWGDVQDGFLEAPAGPLTIVADEPRTVVEIDIASDPQERIQVLQGLLYWIDAEVGFLNPGSPAERSGLEVGDRISVADGVAISNWWDLVDVIEAHPDIPMEVTLEREGRSLTLSVTPEVTQEEDPVTGETVTVGKIGINGPVGEWVYRDVSLTEAVQLGYAETVGMTGLLLDFLGGLVTGRESPKQVGSILTIGSIAGQAAGLGIETFLRFMALLSVNLAVLNLLPIPILDGGHLVFLGIEAVRGKALSLQQRLKWSQFGFVILLGIMIWALSNDVLRLWGT
ncbi:MAG: RIP metalloprotease RseP [Gemmatimonadota bacterium]|nr:RIP metalloprotease RseP [Gemmatimonadota bacterium]